MCLTLKIGHHGICSYKVDQYQYKNDIGRKMDLRLIWGFAEHDNKLLILPSKQLCVIVIKNDMIFIFLNTDIKQNQSDLEINFWKFCSDA